MKACDEATVRGDPHRLKRLLLNLTDNAIKYNQPRGRVEIELVCGARSVVLRMTNTGPGIPPEQLPRVFDRFYRGDPAHGTDVEGSGLGLAIAQWIVQAHRGEIQIASTVNRETVVTVTLPLLQEGLVVAPARRCC